MRRALALVALALLAGCGEREAEAPAGQSSRLVDLNAEPPLVNAFDIDPETGDFLLTTNKGFFRIADGEAKRVDGRVVTKSREAPVGTFLHLYAAGDGRLLGSGHPDSNALPQYLGFMESDDGGRTWRVLSRLGEADLHKIDVVDGRLYAFDAVLSAMLISDDGGRTFTEKFTPRGLIVDFAVDPEDGDHLLASTEGQLFRSEDGGDSWRPQGPGRNVRLSWPAPDALYWAEADGTVQRSSDGGQTWQRVARVEGEPYKLKAVGPEELYLALADGTILHTRDGARSWEPAFTP